RFDGQVFFVFVFEQGRRFTWIEVHGFSLASRERVRGMRRRRTRFVLSFYLSLFPAESGHVVQWPSSNGPMGDCRMAINVTCGQSDDIIDKIILALRVYEADHPRAQIDLYRQNPVSVRLRIIDSDFGGQGKPQRSQQVWRYLGQLPEE